MAACCRLLLAAYCHLLPPSKQSALGLSGKFSVCSDAAEARMLLTRAAKLAAVNHERRRNLVLGRVWFFFHEHWSVPTENAEGVRRSEGA